MQAIVGNNNNKKNIIVNKHKRAFGIIIKHKNIRKINKGSSMRSFPSSSSSLQYFMYPGLCCCPTTTVGTRTFMDTMGRFHRCQHQTMVVVNRINHSERRKIKSYLQSRQNVEANTDKAKSLSPWHRQPESKASPVRGEIFSFPVYQLEQGQQQTSVQSQFDASLFYRELTQTDNSSKNSRLSSYQHDQQQQQQASTTVSIGSGVVFGEPIWTNTTITEHSTPSFPSLVQWPNCSMFMGATELWPSGFSNGSYTIGEQLNTPRPEDVCGFEYGSFGGLGASEAKVNLANVFSTSSITDRSEEDYNNNDNNSRNSIKMHDKKCNKNRNPMTPPSSNREESTLSPGFNSWEFEPCFEEVILSPASFINTPIHSVASPDSSSGDMERKPDELETCVDFIFSPSTVIDGNEESEHSIPLHEEIEQLSNSFYCKSNSLVSVNSNSANGEEIVSPSFLKLLQEEASLPPAAVLVAQTTTEPTAIEALLETTHPSIANSFFSDADEDDDDDELNVKRKKNKQDEPSPVAAARSQAALQIVDSKDESIDVIKTQTQLEHNYTIKLPFDGKSQDLLINTTTVKEASLSQRGAPIAQSKQQSPTIKRDKPQGKGSRMTEDSPRRKIPKLKLKIGNPPPEVVKNDDLSTLTTSHMVIHTPELTNDLLDLEAENLKQESEEFDLLTYITSGTDYDIISKSPIEEKPMLPFTDTPFPAAPVPVSQQSTICGTTLSDLFNPAKRKLPTITIENLEELTASTNGSKRFRSATSSTTSSVYGDNTSETSSTRPLKRRGRPPKPLCSVRDRSEYQHLNEVDMRYREQRDKNNEASRKSRINRKDRELKLESEARELNRQYEVLVNEERKLIKECARWRKAVMRLALL
ncbi:uncharacterized protein LOC131676065 [Topomyia yanbarensis]|uniref:uncharacterized protein LOC131676065 n=1 Tax=Topomyia yanbarensis TaxID=2498891 RepID=UPI00273C056D|nr:uncharacterized protein LOC131676065 [Topomyia yanbarensis]